MCSLLSTWCTLHQQFTLNFHWSYSIVSILCFLFAVSALFRKLYEKTRLPLVPIYGMFPVKLRCISFCVYLQSAEYYDFNLVILIWMYIFLLICVLQNLCWWSHTVRPAALARGTGRKGKLHVDYSVLLFFCFHMYTKMFHELKAIHCRLCKFCVNLTCFYFCLRFACR